MLYSLKQPKVLNSVATRTQSKLAFKGFMDTGYERGDVLCFETVDITNTFKIIAHSKNIIDKVFYAKDGTKVTFGDAGFWQEYHFENNSPEFVEKYGNNRLSCRINGDRIVSYSQAYMSEKSMQKGTVDILLLNYLPELINKI